MGIYLAPIRRHHGIIITAEKVLLMGEKSRPLMRAPGPQRGRRDERGDRMWGRYGFIDAFNLSRNWFADSNLAINQAPIVVMVENCRSGLLWDLFMSCSEVRFGLRELAFSS